MKKLYFGDDSDQGTSTSPPKIVCREPEDKGAQPGSHPKNIWFEQKIFIYLILSDVFIAPHTSLTDVSDQDAR